MYYFQSFEKNWKILQDSGFSFRVLLTLKKPADLGTPIILIRLTVPWAIL